MDKTAVYNPRIVLKAGKPSEVILSLEDYEAILERLEETEDLREIRQLRKKFLRFRPIEEFLKRRPI